MIVEQLTELLKQRPARPQRLVYASDATGCERKLTLSLLGVPATDAVSRDHWLWSAEIGTAIHQQLQSLFQQLYPDCQIELRVEEPGVLSGRIDVLARIGGKMTVIDIKTVSSREYRARTKIGQYKDQINLYGSLTGAEVGCILLVNRDSGELDEIVFDIDNERAEALLNRAAGIVALAKSGVIGRAEWFGSQYCALFCPYRTLCYDLDNTGFVGYNTTTVIEPEVFE